VPVVVTAAETPLGRLVVERLRADGAEVRAVVESPADDLGVPTSLTDWRDAERLGAVIEGAHTVIHLAGVRRFAHLLAAAQDSGLRRIVVVMRPGDSLGTVGLPYEVVALPAPRPGRWRRPDPAALAAVADALVEADRRR
jgi:hypothetical protein